MIDRKEIELQAEELNVHTSHVQRDYIFGWLLAGIYGQSNLSDKLFLKGGNAFRKAYFRKSRYSPDLDFATEQTITESSLHLELNKICDYISTNTEVKFDASRTRIDTTPSADHSRSIQKARVYFKDFYGEESHLVLAVRLDISNLERIHLAIQERPLIHQYSDADDVSTNIKCLKLEELLASKLKCLIQRRHSADLYDFVNATIIRPVVDIDRSEMVQTFLKMTIFGSGPKIVEDLLINLPFQYIKGLWEKYIVFPNNAGVDFDKAVDGFTTIITDLFGSLPVGTSDFAFFPSEYRNPIMQAGQELTLLKVQYNGVLRMVEPYSLVFKRRQDGLAREYFYVFDRTGGSSGPSIKAYVYSGMESIENTDIAFEPRCEVELSKAGQLFGNTYFRGSPGPRYFTSRSSHRYVVKCTTCGKRFYRKTYSTKINPHKNKFGQKCYGRYGIFV